MAIYTLQMQICAYCTNRALCVRVITLHLFYVLVCKSTARIKTLLHATRRLAEGSIPSKLIHINQRDHNHVTAMFAFFKKILPYSPSALF